MAFLAGLCRYRQLSSVSTPLKYNYSWNCRCHIFFPSPTTRWLSTDSTRTDFPSENAYSILGVPETSSFAEIKASFRKLAKETHPDLAESKNDSSASKRFVQILAAYEILSDSEKRVHYDNYLLSQRKLMQKHSERGSKSYMYYESHMRANRQMEVVEWLKWYRLAINDIVSEKRVIVGTGYFDVLQADFYSAIHAAYYGPVIESLDFLPDRFEAEERSVFETPEVLHLVSGRDLFGMVRINDNPRLSFACNEKLPPRAFVGLGMCQFMEKGSNYPNSDVVNDFQIFQTQTKNITSHESDAYKDLELHVCGKVVAVATRVPPKSCCDRFQNEDAQDHIHVFLSSGEGPRQTSGLFSKDSSSDGIDVSRIPLGTITGLGTSPEEGSCFVYDGSGTKTHVIMKHRTLLVKHMHWYSVGEEVSICECRCSRARLPPSKFWLFEPRCEMHDIGGWYIETFGRDKKGHTVPSQRYWDGFDASEQFDKKLHPAMYLLALAYRTLDLEDAKRRKWAVRDIIEVQLFRILSWCKKLV